MEVSKLITVKFNDGTSVLLDDAGAEELYNLLRELLGKDKDNITTYPSTPIYDGTTVCPPKVWYTTS